MDIVKIDLRFKSGNGVPVERAHITAAEWAEIKRLKDSRGFYSRRCEALAEMQNRMRDPERKAVCDILANGSTEALSKPPSNA